MKTIYIAGKITGMEKEAAFLFDGAEFKLRSQGYQVLNPMKLPHNHDKTWINYMRECHRAMTKCDGIYFLDNWEHSDGAKDEFIHALQLDLEFLNKPTPIGIRTYRHFRNSLLNGKLGAGFSLFNSFFLLGTGMLLGILLSVIFTILN